MNQLLRNHITILAAAAAAAIILAVTITWLWSSHQIAKLESEVTKTKNAADEKEQTAARLETEAAEYKQKIDHLERDLAAIQQLARKQDEELTKLNSISNNARADVERARRTKSVASSAAELCQKLAELGYPCQ
jgi:chromosome segregation ATPase